MTQLDHWRRDAVDKPKEGWKAFTAKFQQSVRPVQLSTVNQYKDEEYDTSRMIIFPGAITNQIVIMPKGDPCIMTWTTSSTETAEGFNEFVVGLSVAFPKTLTWLTGAQISAYFRLQIDFSEPLVRTPAYTIDLSACLSEVNFIPFVVSSTTKRILYCFAVVGIAKPLQSILDTVKVDFSWEWFPSQFKNASSFNQTVSTQFWAQGTAPSLSTLGMIDDNIIPPWLFRNQREVFTGFMPFDTDTEAWTLLGGPD